jgi:hypothetical protein
MWFVESLVRVLESMVAATQSAGFQGAMYTAADAPWSTNSLVGFGPAARHLLGTNGRAVRWLVPSWSLNRLVKLPSSVVTRPRCPVYRLLAILG